MEARFWQLAHLSDQQLLDRLLGVEQTQRRTLAELVAQLGELEERRLHLQAASGSLFSYCVQRLGMSEDEACRRIDVARLARRYPVLFTELASGLRRRGHAERLSRSGPATPVGSGFNRRRSADAPHCSAAAALAGTNSLRPTPA